MCFPQPPSTCKACPHAIVSPSPGQVTTVLARRVAGRQLLFMESLRTTQLDKEALGLFLFLQRRSPCLIAG